MARPTRQSEYQSNLDRKSKIGLHNMEGTRKISFKPGLKAVKSWENPYQTLYQRGSWRYEHRRSKWTCCYSGEASGGIGWRSYWNSPRTRCARRAQPCPSPQSCISVIACSCLRIESSQLICLYKETQRWRSNLELYKQSMIDLMMQIIHKRNPYLPNMNFRSRWRDHDRRNRSKP